MQGFDASVAAQLSRFEFDTDTVLVGPAPTLPKDQHTAALRSALGQLRALCAPTAIVEFVGWEWNTDKAQVRMDLACTLSVAHYTIYCNAYGIGPSISLCAALVW